MVAAAPHGDAWLYEVKLDGYRIAAELAQGAVRLYTRRGHDWSARAPSVVADLAALHGHEALIDGELVSLRPDGVSDFQALQNALSSGRSGELVYYAFDLLLLDGVDLRARPLLERKRALAQLLATAKLGAHVRYSEHVRGHGEQVFARACKLGLEGVIAKRADAPYRAGRGKDWLKVKCIARQEFVIGGYTPPGGSRKHLGALLVGVREGDALRYTGKVGTGFSEQSLRDLHARLAPLVRERPPFSPPPKGPDARSAIWVEPRLVAEVAFTEFTDDGRLRHPSFQGLREDKPARAIRRERPAPAP